MTRKKKIYLFFISISLIGLGFYRDFLFKSINALLKAWDFDIDYEMSFGLRFFENYEYESIVHIKWGLTILFTIIYFLLSYFAIKLVFLNKRYNRITVTSYFILVVISALLTLLGFLLPGIAGKTYLISRYLMGIAQSPIVLMILIPAFIFVKRLEKNASQ